MLERAERFVYRRFCSKPGPLEYLIVIWSSAIGLFFALFWSLSDVKHTFIYQHNLIGSPQTWGGIVATGSLLVLLGLLGKRRNIVRAGTMFNFVAWSFAAILYFQNDLWYAFSTVAMFHLLVQAHFYLSASFGTLFKHGD